VSARSAGDATALAAALRAMGIPCDVEARAALALISARAEHVARLALSRDRATALALAKQHGFTHVAVELSADAPADADAPLLRH
jgi:hypothetical protein